MGFWDVFSITGTLVTKAVSFGSKVIKPILNGITNIANVVKETAGVLSMVPVIGAVSSQIGAAANIISSVSSAGVEIIGVGERFVAKHAPEPSERSESSEPVVSVPPPLFMAPVNESAAMSINASPGIVPSNTSTSPIFNVVPAPFPTAAPLAVPIIPKSNVYPERRILRVRRPSAYERNRRYQKAHKYEKDLRDILDLLDEPVVDVSSVPNGGNVPALIKSGGFLGSSAVSAGSKRALWT